jgi:hypothetical protein
MKQSTISHWVSSKMPPRSSLNTELTLGVNTPLKDTKETKVEGYGL